MVCSRQIHSRILLLIALVTPGVSWAYTPALQASIFNAAVQRIGFVKLEQLIDSTKVLYGTLNAKEQLSMYGHGSLKIASYMYLVDYWREYSMARVLSERGVRLSPDDLEKAGVSQDIYNLKLSLFGPENLGIFDSCPTSTNKVFSYSYVDLLKSISRIQSILNLKSETQGAKAAMVYLKAYYYQRLHVPNSLYSYTNKDCQSDVNGLLTCVDRYIDLSDVNSDRMSKVKEYQMRELKELGVEDGQLAELQSCPLTIWHYMQSAGGVEPLNDGEVVAASESLLLEVRGETLHRSRKIDIQSIMVESKDVMKFMYMAKEIAPPANGTNTQLMRAVLLTQMQLAALRTATLLQAETML
jgi:hypothetical protein